MGAVIAVLLVAPPVVGLLLRRRLVVLLPLVAWPLLYVGVTRHWWGNGVGDGWQAVALALTLLGVGSTALAVAAGRALRNC